MRLQIFDVEHGACSLLTADNNTRLMIDCGHNATTGWKPGTYLVQQGIPALDMLAVTNYDEDHASASADLFDKVYVAWLLRNASVTLAMRFPPDPSEEQRRVGCERNPSNTTASMNPTKPSPQI